MGELEQSGLIRIEQGRGTSCRNMPSTTPSASARASENLRSQGVLGHLETLGSQTLRAADIAKAPGPAAQSRQVACVSGGQGRNRPISASEHY